MNIRVRGREENEPDQEFQGDGVGSFHLDVDGYLFIMGTDDHVIAIFSRWSSVMELQVGTKV